MNKNFFLMSVAALLALAVTGTSSQSQTERAQVLTTEATKESKADETKSFSEYEAVVAALRPYINAAKTGDGNSVRTAFFDHAHIVGSLSGEFYNMDAETFKGAVSDGGPSPEVEHHIAWIDISGPAAAAKVEFINWGGNRFTDFFVLYKHDGEWKISGKVYDSHSNN